MVRSSFDALRATRAAGSLTTSSARARSCPVRRGSSPTARRRARLQLRHRLDPTLAHRTSTPCHGREAGRFKGTAVAAVSRSSRACVSRATSASSWTSTEPISSSEPSSATAASPALLSMSSATRVSIVCEAMMRHAVTGLLLTDAVDPVDRLGLLGVGPESSARDDVRGDLEVDADARRGERADDDGDLRVGGERVDVALPDGRGLVAADRGVPQPAAAEGPSAASITSMCLAKKTTLPTLRASWAA